jgi:hypothetical protein
MSTILEILCYTSIGIVLFYFLSRWQMKAWLHEIDKQFGKKIEDRISKLKTKTEKDERKEE